MGSKNVLRKSQMYIVKKKKPTIIGFLSDLLHNRNVTHERGIIICCPLKPLNSTMCAAIAHLYQALPFTKSKQ